MAEIARTIITSLENLADAVALSVFEGQAQATFDGRATTDCPSGAANLCISTGWTEETIVAAYESDPRFFVSEKVGRNWRGSLADYPAALGGPACELA